MRGTARDAAHRRGRPAAALLLLPLALLAVGSGPAPAQERDVALVHRLLLDRQAVVERGAEGVVQAELGQRLRSGNLVATSPNTRAAIRFVDDGSLVRLNPNSRLQVTSEGEGGALAKTLELEFGELWARVTQQEGGASFEVETPSGVAAVVGTDLYVRVDQDGTTTVITLEGAVDFFNGAGSVEVPAGSRATAASNEAPAQVAEADASEIEALGDLVQAPGDEGTVRVEIPLQNAQGVTRTLVLEMPRDEASSVVDPGGGR